MEESATKRFGRYEIVGELGRGAMGVVYKARDPQIDRLVALKTVSLRGQEPEEETEFRHRFMNEAKAAGRLHHPGIVSVFDMGEEGPNNEPYIVLEHVVGEALNKVLAREKKLPLARALQIAEEIADALEYAHEQGVTHRDIKPGNILITKDGHAKIADFGIAKLNLAHFTLPGKVLGTPAYMAPEQLSGEGADSRSDLFSLGVILYAMITGHSPFQGDSATTVCFKVANREPVPASALDLSLPPELDAIISHAMAKNPDERYQHGAELANDLRQLEAQLKRGGTTTSLAAISATALQRAQKADLNRRPAVGVMYAAKLIRAVIQKAPIRDLILGAATIVMLVIVGVQSKLLVWTHDQAVDPAQINADQLRASHVPANTGAVADTQQIASAAPKPAMRKASAKTSGKKAPVATPVPDKEKVKETVVVPSCSIELAVRHQFKDATLTVWVDDNLALTRPLHGGAQKRLVVFNGVRGIESETLKIPAGKHVLRFKTQTADQTVNLSKTISADFIGGNDRTLQITYDKHNTSMKMEWQ
jgi:serine/threonine-protein kinase